MYITYMLHGKFCLIIRFFSLVSGFFRVEKPISFLKIYVGGK